VQGSFFSGFKTNRTGEKKVSWIFEPNGERKFAMFMDEAVCNLQKYIDRVEGEHAAGDKSAVAHDDRLLIAFQVVNSVAYLLNQMVINCDIKVRHAGVLSFFVDRVLCSRKTFCWME
jgi:hypothetical protein